MYSPTLRKLRRKRDWRRVFSTEMLDDMNELIIICSWCNRIQVDKGDWQEIEEFLKNSALPDAELLPQPSHGMCNSCYKIVSKKFHNKSKP